ncbi:Uncharacterised protein [Salmonella enterica subsp. enterica serovar Daytona]|uniref:Uncharacterized protein n=1 Tax=Salmonella enterica subsp. enterica serovar Daytona TaxID=1962639 RepID=A0A447JLS3_SALET|nr:Uncharacterised protein [Salmonella enterica subsp. enterica serovar Daytona]
MNTFQTHMNQYPAPGIPGAFASDNPHASYVAGEGALITGPDGLVIARFAWGNQRRLPPMREPMRRRVLFRATGRLLLWNGWLATRTLFTRDVNVP